MQRNQRPPAKGGSVPAQYDWHQQAPGPRDAPLTQSYPAHKLTNPHQQPSRGGGMNIPLSTSRNLHHSVPPSGHSAPLLPLPVPQPYSSPPTAMQGSSKHQGGQGGGPKKYSPVHHPPSQQQQVNLGDLSAGTMSLADLAPRVQALGFPASCSFVLGLLERYFSSQLDSTKDSSTPPQLAHDKITGLIDMFILHIDRPLTTPPTALSTLNPVKEMQLLLILHAQLQEQANLELRYCIFDALFGGNETKSSSDRFDLMSKLVSLSITLASEGVLLCAALWMKACPLLGLTLAKSLCYEFCVLLPDALDPLLGLADHSPLLAYHMAATFTTLYPLHVVGKRLPEVDPSQLHPPIKVLEIILHWVESKPELFCHSRHQDFDPSKLPLLSHSHSQSGPSPQASMYSPITGIIQWCVLAPMVNDKKLYSGTKTKPADSIKTGTGLNSHFSDTIGTSNSTKSIHTEDGFQSLLARLHAELLSALLCHSQATPTHGRPGDLIDGLSSDDVAVLVASLIAYSQKVGVAGGGARCTEMEEGVERFAQFLQISMSSKVLQLKSEDIKFIASTLPRNRLLELVITHTT